MIASFMWFFLFFLSTSALAHSGGENYLFVRAAISGSFTADWNIPITQVEDLWKQQTIDVQSRLTNAAANHRLIFESVRDGLRLRNESADCEWKLESQSERMIAGEPFERLSFSGHCGRTDVITVHWSYLNDLESGSPPLIVSFESPGGFQSGEFPEHQTEMRFGLVASSKWLQFLNFVRAGAFHIWRGIDHILFLFLLLLPAVFHLEKRKWLVRAEFRSVMADVLKTVTAFTVAHSITLCLVTFDFLHLPVRFVESTIALSVLLAALNNIFPRVGDGRWILAFLFGLIHGAGFAEVLKGVWMPAGVLARSLLGFNIGVEIGQLALVALVLPLIFFLRGSGAYRKIIFPAGSLMMGLIATGWLIDRVFQLGWMPF